MKRNLILIFITLLSVAIIVSTSIDGNRSRGVIDPVIQAGYVDLSHWDFNQSGTVFLAGEWEFYYNQFLTRKDFDQGKARNPIMVKVPSNRLSMGKVKPFDANKFYGTMRLKVKLPPGSQIYSLKTNIVLTSYKLYIDDVLTSQIGQPGTTFKDSKSSYKMSYADFNPKAQEVELIYQTADFTKGDCAIAPPELGLASKINETSRVALGRDLFLFGMLLIMGIYHLGLFAMRSKDQAPLYFSIFCLSFATRMLFVGERFMYNLVNFPLRYVTLICYSCAFIGVCALFMFIKHAVDGLFPKWYGKACQILGTVSVVVLLMLPFEFYEQYLMFFSSVVGLLLLYTLFKLVQGVRGGYEFAGLVLAGAIFLGAALVNDLIYQYTLSNRASMIPVGVFVFTLTQSLTLSSKFSRAFSTSEKLTAENRKMMEDLKDANQNLENRVLSRTEDLQAAINELNHMSNTDYLTKLSNRRHIFEKMEGLVAAGRTFYIALGDIDKFKQINDTYGHDCGDKVLVTLADALVNTVGDEALVGRWGGEEFLIVLLTDHADEAKRLAGRICESVRNISYKSIHYPQIKTTITLGLYPYKGIQSLDVCIACADEALYKGKDNGRNQFVMYQVEKTE